MLYTLRKPPAGFGGLVTRHFQVSAAAVRASCGKMIDAAQHAVSTKGGGGNKATDDGENVSTQPTRMLSEVADGVVFPPSLGFLKALESLVPKLDKAFAAVVSRG